MATVVALVVGILAALGTCFSAYLQAQANKDAARLNYEAAQRGSDIKMVEIAIGILRAPTSDDVSSIRSWAMDIIDSNTTRKLTAKERSALLKNALPYTPSAPSTSLFSPSSPNLTMCSDYKRNADGSWTSLSPGGNLNVSKSLLDILCGAPIIPGGLSLGGTGILTSPPGASILTSPQGTNAPTSPNKQ